jgi:hypothetical protein
MSEITIGAVDWLLFNYQEICDMVNTVMVSGRLEPLPLTGLGGSGCSVNFERSEVEDEITDVECVEFVIKQVCFLCDNLKHVISWEKCRVFTMYYEEEKTYKQIKEEFDGAYCERTLKNWIKKIKEYTKQGLEDSGVTGQDLRKMYDMFGKKIRKNKKRLLNPTERRKYEDD